MSILNSRFDVISHDPLPNARAGLMTVLAVAGAPGPGPGGTPTPGTMIAGTIVSMNNVGAAIRADEVVVGSGAAPALLFTVVDGDVDYDGAFVHRVTCIQGGAEFQLDVAANCAGVGAVVPNTYLTVGTGAAAGQWVPAVATDQIYGIVGALGLNTVNGTLHVIVPQGISPAMV